jgi:hypothetical protein
VTLLPVQPSPTASQGSAFVFAPRLAVNETRAFPITHSATHYLNGLWPAGTKCIGIGVGILINGPDLVQLDTCLVKPVLSLEQIDYYAQRSFEICCRISVMNLIQ